MTYLINTTIHILAQWSLKSADVNSSTYIDFNKNNKEKDPKFKVRDLVRISKYKSIL